MSCVRVHNLSKKRHPQTHTPTHTSTQLANLKEIKRLSFLSQRKGLLVTEVLFLCEHDDDEILSHIQNSLLSLSRVRFKEFHFTPIIKMLWNFKSFHLLNKDYHHSINLKVYVCVLCDFSIVNYFLSLLGKNSSRNVISNPREMNHAAIRKRKTLLMHDLVIYIRLKGTS